MASRNTIYAAWVAGWALLLILVVRAGAGDLASAVAACGWGLGAVICYGMLIYLVDAYGWRMFIAPRDRPGLLSLLRMRWISESINALLPVAQLGGHIVRAGQLAKAGPGGVRATASVVVDVTAGVLTQIVFALLGVGLILRLHVSSALLGRIGMALGFLSILVAIFCALQRRGLFAPVAARLAHFLGTQAARSLSANAGELDRAIQATYARRHDLWIGAFWRFFSWLLGTGEVWLALYFLGHPVSLAEALLFESFGQALRSAAFLVPGAVGVQEGGFMLLGAELGLDPSSAIALSLVKRVREWALGIPAIIVWQLGRRAPRVQDLTADVPAAIKDSALTAAALDEEIPLP